MMKPPIGTWRVLTATPELGYAGSRQPAPAGSRTASGFGLWSIILPVLAAYGVLIFFLVDQTFTSTEAKLIAVVIGPISLIGCAFAITGVVRRDKRRGYGVVGIFANLALAVAGGFFWIVAHVAP